MDIQPHQSIREYLLGSATSADAAGIEERLLTDDEFYQELLIVEDELVDQYLAGLLTSSERESCEKYFLATPERRQKLRFGRNLKKYVSRAEADLASRVDDLSSAPERNTAAAAPALSRRRFWSWSNPVFSYSFAGAAIVLVVAAVLIVRSLNAPPKGPGQVLVVELVPGLSRGDQGLKQIIVPANIATVQLQLRVSNIPAYQTYRAILQTTDGREISRQDDLRRDPASNDRIVCPIPANLLKPSDYNLKLSGLNQQGEYEDIARYSFRVTK